MDRLNKTSSNKEIVFYLATGTLLLEVPGLLVGGQPLLLGLSILALEQPK